MARFFTRWDKSHWDAATRILRYLKGTKYHRLTYRPAGEVKVVGYSDADWAADTKTRQSTSGMMFLLNKTPFSWATQKQPCVSTSNTEAEYVAIMLAAKEAVWFTYLLDDMGFTMQNRMPIKIDSTGALDTVKNPEHHKLTKHIHVRHHAVRRLYDLGIIGFQKVGTDRKSVV